MMTVGDGSLSVHMTIHVFIVPVSEFVRQIAGS